jgi:hypothetical protein
MYYVMMCVMVYIDLLRDARFLPFGFKACRIHVVQNGNLIFFNTNMGLKQSNCLSISRAIGREGL